MLIPVHVRKNLVEQQSGFVHNKRDLRRWLNYPSDGKMLLRENEEVPAVIPEVSALFLSV